MVIEAGGLSRGRIWVVRKLRDFLWRRLVAIVVFVLNKLVCAFQFFRPDSARLAGVGSLILFNAATGLLKPWPLAIIVDCIFGVNPFFPWLTQLTGGMGKER